MRWNVVKEAWSHPVTRDGRAPGKDLLTLQFSFMVDADSVLQRWSVRVRLSWAPDFQWEREALGPCERVELEVFLEPFRLRGELSMVEGSNKLLLVFTPALHFGFFPVMQEFAGGLVPVPASRHEPLPPLPPPVPPFRPLPPEPAPAGPPLIKPASRDSDLFPYLFMRIWPEPPPEAVALHFVQASAEGLAGGAFFQELVTLRASGMPQAREQMECRAVRYVEDAQEEAPYVEHPYALTGPIASYPTIERLVREYRGENPQELMGEIWTCLGMGPEQAREWLTSPEYLLLRLRLWQSYCALVISLGFSTPTREALARLLVVDHLLRWLVTPREMPPTMEELRALARATLVLPASIFPLPPAGGSPLTSPPREDGWILPYAIGELQMVRRRLVGYALGELAHVESVMAGERRQTTRRKASRTQQSTERLEMDATGTAREAHSATTSLTESMATQVAANLTSFNYKDFSTQYGPPTTVTLNGGWTWQTEPGSTQGDGSQFARDVLERVVEQVAHQVTELRSSTTLREWEESTVSVFDNTGGTGGRRGLYRWLNEVYRACVVNYGNRLVLEVLLPAPAARYVAADMDLPDTAFPPVPPSALGIESYEDIHPGSFPMLAARYPSPELELPPAPRRVSGIARSGVPLELTLPEGHAAASVRIGYVLLPGQGSLLIAGVAGRTPVNLDVAGTGITCLEMQGEEGTVQVVLQTSGPFSSPPVQLEPAQLTVDIQAVPSERTMEEWRLRTYQRIQRVYAAQLQEYTAPPEGGSPEAPQPRLSQRAVIRRELRNGTTELLFHAMREHLGPGPATPPSGGLVRWELARPRYLQFFARAFEWNEMSYSFLQGGQDPTGGKARATPRPATSEEGFQEFLEASYAQLLLPVRPGEVMAVLYFLASGMLWNGPAAWTAVHTNQVALALELKKLGESPPVERVVSAPWEVLVPTSLSVLQEGSGALESLCFPQGEVAPEPGRELAIVTPESAS